ncbi:MAG: hypothetical protein ACE14L_15685 [Terriglobales bacterium]
MSKKKSKANVARPVAPITEDDKKKAKAGLVRWSVKPRKELLAELERRDEMKVQRFRESLSEETRKVIELDDFIYSVLERPEIKALPKPKMAVIRVLTNERGLSKFTANNRWNEFELICLGQYECEKSCGNADHGAAFGLP